MKREDKETQRNPAALGLQDCLFPDIVPKAGGAVNSHTALV